MFRSSIRYMKAAVPRNISQSQTSSIQSQIGVSFCCSLCQFRPFVRTTDCRSTPLLVREFRTAPVLRNRDTGWLHNILEDSSIPIRVANVTKNELTLTDGLVVPSSCIFLNGNVFVWNPPVLDPMNVMPNGKGWEKWTDDVWNILEVVNPRPEILIIGTGETVLPIPSRVRSRIYALGIQLDVQNTRNASSTYNLLSEEGRRVSAAFCPTK